MQFVNRDLIVYQELDSVDNTDAYREDDVVDLHPCQFWRNTPRNPISSSPS